MPGVPLFGARTAKTPRGRIEACQAGLNHAEEANDDTSRRRTPRGIFIVPLKLPPISALLSRPSSPLPSDQGAHQPPCRYQSVHGPVAACQRVGKKIGKPGRLRPAGAGRAHRGSQARAEWPPSDRQRHREQRSIGSDQAEKANDLLVTRRQQRGGMQWCLAASDGLTALQALVLNGGGRQFDQNPQQDVSRERAER